MDVVIGELLDAAFGRALLVVAHVAVLHELLQMPEHVAADVPHRHPVVLRRDGNEAVKKLLKDKKVTEDEEHGALEQIQKLTDDEIKKMEELAKGKEKEVLSI